ncbi:diguanylate cyclase [Vibrio sp. 99-70-13A1]|uniref:diguanylate cyclase n=1 Tax=Vibrio sp. 99-70-13A1 TaxID=2607601 RepID=UPI001493B624|nr:diguanylate cyclase [Vibrio sp. 99-70-13A1]NOH99169.1 diguanylate cyclase [Vibrio sp. 99-70-13A1]
MNTNIIKLVGQFFFVAFALGLVPALYINSELDRIETQYNRNVQQSSYNQIEYSSHKLKDIIREIAISIPTLAQSKTLLKAIDQPTIDNTASVEDLWNMLALGQKYYSQIRYLDLYGNEVIRINYKDGKSNTVPSSELQNKSSRDYFKEAQSLTIGQVVAHGIDLEIENGKIVQPLIPALRIMTTVATKDNQKLGYFIVNLSMSDIYQQLQYEKQTNQSLPVLLNQSGHIIMDNDLDHAFGHLLPNRFDNTYAITQPALWSEIQKHASGSYLEGESWYIYTDVGPDIQQISGPLYMVLKVENIQFNELYSSEVRSTIEQAVTLGIIIFLLSSGFILWNYTHKKNSIESQLATAAMNGMSALVITDRNNRIIKVNQEFTRISGYTIDEVKGRQPSMFASGKYNQEFYINMWAVIRDKDMWEGEVVNKRKDGSLITEILRIQAIKDKLGVIQFYVASFVDISRHKELEKRLRDLSEKDALAGCWNRRKFDIELRDECLRTTRYPDKIESCLAILDIDHFKRINDTHGHDYGDAVIQTVAKVLERECRETDFVARIGGEEFGIILPHTSTNEAYCVLNRLRIAIHIELEYKVTISGGVTNITDNAKVNYKCADLALYDAKTSGRNAICIFLDEEVNQIA